MKISYDKKSAPEKSNLIPTKFKQFVDKKARKLNEVSPESKVIAAINKILSKQTAEDGINYYVAGENVWLPKLAITEGHKDGKPVNSYSAKGRFKLGKRTKDGASFDMAEFDIKFRDSTDEMGLPDIEIEQANMSLLDRNSPLQG